MSYITKQYNINMLWDILKRTPWSIFVSQVCVCVSSQGTHACPDGVTWSPPSQKTIEIVA